MANYIIVCDEVTGVKGLRYLKGSKVSASDLMPGSIPNLIKIGAIEQEKREQEQEKPKKNQVKE